MYSASVIDLSPGSALSNLPGWAVRHRLCAAGRLLALAACPEAACRTARAGCWPSCSAVARLRSSAVLLGAVRAFSCRRRLGPAAAGRSESNCSCKPDSSLPSCLQGCLRRVLAEALQPVEALAEQLATATGQPYLGIDASLAPALEPPSIPAAYELLGLGRFGGAGTLAVSGG